MEIRQFIKTIAALYLISNLIRTNENMHDSIATIFAPGLGTAGSVNLFERLQNSFPSSSLGECVQFPDTAIPKSSFNRIIFKSLQQLKLHKGFSRETDFGGINDIEAIHQTVTIKLKPKDPFILFGHCKGSCALINYVTTHNPKNLKAIVLICPSFKLKNIIHAYNAKIGFHEQYCQIVLDLIFPYANQKGNNSYEIFNKITNKNLPILIIHSVDDIYIPFVESLKLYKNLKRAHLKNVYLAKLEGSHSINYSINYLTAAHTFYKHLGLSHNEIYATNDINNYIYDLTTIENQIIEYKLKQNMELLCSQKRFNFLLKKIISK